MGEVSWPDGVRFESVPPGSRHVLLTYELTGGPPEARLRLLQSGALEVVQVSGGTPTPRTDFDREAWDGGARWEQVDAAVRLLHTLSSESEAVQLLGPPDDRRTLPEAGWQLTAPTEQGRLLYWPGGGYGYVFDTKYACGPLLLCTCVGLSTRQGWAHIVHPR